MSWWDDVFDFGSKAFDSVTSFAKENPALAGAGAGLVAHHLTGGKGEDNLTAALGGAALGAGANYLFGNQTSAAPPGSGSTAPTVGTGAAPTPSASAPVSSAATAGMGVSNTGAFGEPAADAAGGTFAGNSGVTGDTGGTMMGTLGTGPQKVRKFGQDNEAVLSLAGKGVSAYLGNKAKSDAAGRVQDYAGQFRTKADEAFAANTQIVNQNNADIGKQNAVMDQLSADASAIDPQRAAVQAYTAGLTRVSDQANRNAAAETSKGYSAATVAANKRRGNVGATTAASTLGESARTGAQSRRTAGLGAVKYSGYQQQAVPEYNSQYAEAVGGPDSTAKTTEGAQALFDDVMGYSKRKAQEQVGK